MKYKGFVAAALLAASSTVQAVTEADLAAIRSQIEALKLSYEERIAALEARLVEAEASLPAPQPMTAVTNAGGFNPEVSLILQGSYRQMKDVPGRSISGFATAGLDKLNRRGWATDESELVLAANVDPYWRGQAVLAMLDSQVSVEEAWFQSLGIGHGLGLKIGRFRSGLGYLNEQHPHARDFSDAPLMYQAMFGDSYTQDGLQLKWLAPTPVFLEIGGEFARGASFPGTERNRNGAGSSVLFAHLGDDLGVENSWRAGISWLQTRASKRSSIYEGVDGSAPSGAFSGDSSTWLADFVWKWAPDGNAKYRSLKVQGEYFVRRENGDLNCTGGPCAASVASGYRTRQSGWYGQTVYQFAPEWRGGLRYEQLDSGQRDFGNNAVNLLSDHYRPKKLSAMIDYSWSEFSRVRLQLAQDKSMPGLIDNQLTVQYIMSLGAHGAHKF